MLFGCFIVIIFHLLIFVLALKPPNPAPRLRRPCKASGLLSSRCTDVREIWYHKRLSQKQMENSEITIYEGTSPETKASQDVFESQFITLRMHF